MINEDGVLLVHREPPGCPFCPYWPDKPCEIECEENQP